MIEQSWESRFFFFRHLTRLFQKSTFLIKSLSSKTIFMTSNSIILSLFFRTFIVKFLSISFVKFVNFELQLQNFFYHTNEMKIKIMNHMNKIQNVIYFHIFKLRKRKLKKICSNNVESNNTSQDFLECFFFDCFLNETIHDLLTTFIFFVMS